MVEKYAHQGLAVLAVNAWDEPKGDLADFAKEQKLKQRICLQGRGVAKQYGVTGLPTVLWIGQDGQVVDVELGFEGPEELDRRTRRLLSRSGHLYQTELLRRLCCDRGRHQ